MLDNAVVTSKKVRMKDCNVDWPNWQGEMLATLMFVVQDGQILLIEKLRGIGKGKINGPGGKIDPGETPTECVIRECQEELHITPKEPVKMGELWFAMSDMEDIHCHVFIAHEFDGVPIGASLDGYRETDNTILEIKCPLKGTGSDLWKEVAATALLPEFLITVLSGPSPTKCAYGGIVNAVLILYMPAGKNKILLARTSS